MATTQTVKYKRSIKKRVKKGKNGTHRCPLCGGTVKK